MRDNTWFDFRNSADNKSAEILIYDVIGSYGVNAKSFIAQLKAITAKNITLRIHSPGGGITEGYAIFNALKRHPATIEVFIDGLAASMASIIAMVGDTVEIAENGFIMIHNPSAYSDGGESKDLRRTADLLDKMKTTLINTYAQKSGLGTEEISQMMDDETWLTADEALEKGFVDFIGENRAIKNSFDLSRFRNSAVAVDMQSKALTHHAQNSQNMDLTAALAKVNDLENQKKNWDTLKAALEKAKTEAESKVVTLEGEKTTLTNQVKALEGEKLTLTNKVTNLEGEVTTLKNSAKTAEQKGQEIAAAHGAEGVGKSKDSVAAGAEDLVAFWKSYQAADATGKAQMLAKEGDKLEKAAAAFDKAQKS